ncbi:MAG: GHMP kinase [Nitrospinae bacterium]|nr:GHMP kinase [Nitrospinota bacterium]
MTHSSKAPHIVKAQAPTRIDLAGGTLDLWPLHCFFPGSVTVNAAIDLYARVTIERRQDAEIHLHSNDSGMHVAASGLSDLNEKKGLDLLRELVRFYSPECGFNLTTDCAAPMGSGIAGSSALNIALNGALNAFTGSRYSKEKMVEIAKNLEANVIGIPTGVQDYYPALYGGLNAIKFLPQGTKRENLNPYLAEFISRSILCYTGKSRFSGANNWEILKRAVEGDKAIRKGLEGIKDAALKLREAILGRDRKGIAEAISEEWKWRKGLSRGVSHPAIEKLIRAAARKGKIAAKICGAGGGGCLYAFVLEGDPMEIETALKVNGGKILPFAFVKKGLSVLF